MKAAVLRKLKSDLSIEELKLPKLKYGQILVEVHSSGICGRQIQEIMGYKGEDKFLPHLLGHEGGGIVKKIGPGVSKCKENDHVVLHWRKSKGIESEFPNYESQDGYVGGGLVTTFNSEVIVSENRLTVVPKSLDFEFASLLGCSMTTSLGLINKEAKLKIGESVLIIGCGSVGMNLVQASKLVSGYPIICADISEEKLKHSLNLGASNSINLRDKNMEIVDECKKICGSKGVDVVVDTTGIPELINKGYEILCENGRLIMVGQPKKGEDIVLKSAADNFKGKKILDSQGGLTNPDIDINNYIKIIENNKVDLKKIITKRVSLEKINLAIEEIKLNKIIGKCIIEF